MRRSWCAVPLGFLFFYFPAPSDAAENESGKALLEKNRGRCHALAAGTSSPLKQAPNLWNVLRSYSTERLQFELSEGIGSRHKNMPQIQFSSEEIEKIENYLVSE
jgi:cytochrome c